MLLEIHEHKNGTTRTTWYTHVVTSGTTLVDVPALTLTKYEALESLQEVLTKELRSKAKLKGAMSRG